MHPKQFRVKISAYYYHADFNIECIESPLDIENAIVDKLGKGDIKWEYLGEMHDPRCNRITYEEVIKNGGDSATLERPLHTEKGSGSSVGAGASERGQIYSQHG